LLTVPSPSFAPFAPSRETLDGRKPVLSLPKWPDPTVLSLSKGRIASNRSGFLSDAARMAIAARLGTVTR
jgi:hypothetical protein